MSGVAGYSGWRWIFIVEGLITVVGAILAKPFIVDWPEKATFLNDEEREMLLSRLREDVQEVGMDRLDSDGRKRVFGDWKIYLGFVLAVDPSLPAMANTYLEPEYSCTLD